MTGSQSRLLNQQDYPAVLSALYDLVSRLQAEGGKAMYSGLDWEKAFMWLSQHEHTYIVADSFLVAYAVALPWYGKELILSELLVLRLRPGAPFAVVPDFLEASARAAGATIAAAGTALATSDRALAALYARSGFREASRTMTKEIT